jgi:hypothetical protein
MMAASSASTPVKRISDPVGQIHQMNQSAIVSNNASRDWWMEVNET